MLLLSPYLTRLKRNALLETMLEPALREVAWRNVPVLRKLPQAMQEEMEGLIKTHSKEING